MPKDLETTTDEQKKLQDAKEMEFYSQSVAAWYMTRLECDKSLLFMSSGAIAIIASFLIAGNILRFCVVVLGIVSAALFLIALLGCIYNFYYNSRYIEEIISPQNSSSEKLLKISDTLVIISFSIAAILLFITIIIHVTMLQTSKMEIAKMQNNDATFVRVEGTSEGTNRIDNTSYEKKSFAGASNLRPSSTPNTNATNQGTQNTGTAATNSGDANTDNKK